MRSPLLAHAVCACAWWMRGARRHGWGEANKAIGCVAGPWKCNTTQQIGLKLQLERCPLCSRPAACMTPWPPRGPLPLKLLSMYSASVSRWPPACQWGRGSTGRRARAGPWWAKHWQLQPQAEGSGHCQWHAGPQRLPCPGPLPRGRPSISQVCTLGHIIYVARGASAWVGVSFSHGSVGRAWFGGVPT
jgi:hypothetical protein